ncbi:MAG: hypothetical protein MJZ29_11730 [Bacteroidaceae bacterium]|nr:hypothetical protein [Bacteroidaceae bacterium]
MIKEFLHLGEKVENLASGTNYLIAFEQYNKFAAATDLIDRGYGKLNVDFLQVNLCA